MKTITLPISVVEHLIGGDASAQALARLKVRGLLAWQDKAPKVRTIKAWMPIDKYYHSNKLVPDPENMATTKRDALQLSSNVDGPCAVPVEIHYTMPTPKKNAR